MKMSVCVPAGQTSARYGWVVKHVLKVDVQVPVPPMRRLKRSLYTFIRSNA